MDTSEVYVKMCEKAWEIQELCPTDYPGNMGNWYWNKRQHRKCNKCKSPGGGDYCQYCGNKMVREESGYPSSGDSSDAYKFTWLPRQDQLQEIDGRHWREFDAACEYERSMLSDTEKKIATKEQCGLRVAMRKFGKIWNEEDWIKE